MYVIYLCLYTGSDYGDYGREIPHFLELRQTVSTVKEGMNILEKFFEDYPDFEREEDNTVEIFPTTKEENAFNEIVECNY